MIHSVGTCLDAWAARTPDSSALLNVRGEVLSFAGLQLSRQSIEAQLRTFGVRSGDHVALLMSSGPELAIAMLAVVSFATGLPIDPSLTADNMADLIQRCGATALVCDDDNAQLASDVARRCNTRLLRVSPTVEFGQLVINGELRSGDGPRDEPSANAPSTDDVAVLIATSGTTGRPKIIRLRHRHVLASAEALVDALQLTATDRALAVVPFWFGQGFVSTLVTSLSVGGSVVSARLMMPEQLDHWLDVLRPTWYTAPPSMHAHVLDRSQSVKSGHRLRFIRAAGAVLPEELRRALESRFDAPVIDVYGLTEALGVATTPLPPRPRPEGSVGLPTATAEVAVVDSDGAIVPRGTWGEIIIRGPMVSDGYVDDDAETALRFRNGWLYTGDVGMQDEAGYLFVAGRAGDLINHSGQKVAPAEVEDVLSTHPAVADVAVFAIPHDVNGHDVAAAVVLRADGAESAPDARAIRQFASGKLPAWKLPSVIAFVPELPRTSSGKVLRSQLSERVAQMALAETPRVTEPALEPPRTAVEESVAAIFARYLKKATISRHEDFFALGGDSLKAMQVVEDIRDVLGQALKVSAVYRWPTVAELAEEVERSRTRRAGAAANVRATTTTTFVKLFYPSNLDGIAATLTPSLDVVDIIVPERVILDGSPHSVESLAARCIADLDAVSPAGPYVLAGHSFAALIAFEAARQLRAANREVVGVVLVDGAAPGVSPGSLRRVAGRARFHASRMTRQSLSTSLRYGVDKLGVGLRDVLGEVLFKISRRMERPMPAGAPDAITYSRTLSNAYTPGTFDGQVLVIRATESHPGTRDDRVLDLGWGAYAAGGIRVVDVEGNHETILVGDSAREIAGHINAMVGATASSRA